MGIRSLSDHFTRVTFFGAQFNSFGTMGLDQRIKIVLPLPGRGLTDIGADDERTGADGTWYTRWRELPDADRNPFRTYTIRAVRPELRQVDVDFVTHPEFAGKSIALASDEASFYYTLSYEQLDQLSSDLLVNFGSTREESDAFLTASYAQAMPQVQAGTVASPVGAAFISSVSPPTGLSLSWGLADYVALLAAAVKP